MRFGCPEVSGTGLAGWEVGSASARPSGRCCWGRTGRAAAANGAEGAPASQVRPAPSPRGTAVVGPLQRVTPAGDRSDQAGKPHRGNLLGEGGGPQKGEISREDRPCRNKMRLAEEGKDDKEKERGTIKGRTGQGHFPRPKDVAVRAESARQELGAPLRRPDDRTGTVVCHQAPRRPHALSPHVPGTLVADGHHRPPSWDVSTDAGPPPHPGPLPSWAWPASLTGQRDKSAERPGRPADV